MTTEQLTTLESIHKAAKEEFLEKGFKSAFLRNIVKTAGMTTGAFYGYYKSKEAFKLLLCCSEGTRFAGMVDEMVEIEIKGTHDFVHILN